MTSLTRSFRAHLSEAPRCAQVRQYESVFATLDASYQPKLNVIIVQKRINVRIFRANVRAAAALRQCRLDSRTCTDSGTKWWQPRMSCLCSLTACAFDALSAVFGDDFARVHLLCFSFCQEQRY